MDLASTENISESKVVAECQHLRDFLTQALCGWDEGQKSTVTCLRSHFIFKKSQLISSFISTTSYCLNLFPGSIRTYSIVEKEDRLIVKVTLSGLPLTEFDLSDQSGFIRLKGGLNVCWRLDYCLPSIKHHDHHQQVLVSGYGVVGAVWKLGQCVGCLCLFHWERQNNTIKKYPWSKAVQFPSSCLELFPFQSPSIGWELTPKSHLHLLGPVNLKEHVIVITVMKTDVG